MVASKTCTEVYRRMKQLMPDLPAAVPGSPLVGTKRKGNAPQKRKNATQVMHVVCLKERMLSFMIDHGTDFGNPVKFSLR